MQTSVISCGDMAGLETEIEPSLSVVVACAFITSRVQK